MVRPCLCSLGISEFNFKKSTSSFLQFRLLRDDHDSLGPHYKLKSAVYMENSKIFFSNYVL